VIERRASGGVPAEGRTLRGLAIPYGVETRINGGTESIRAGAVTASLAGRDILALVDHDSGKVLGRTRSGTLRLAEDTRGVSFEIDLPDTTAARDVLALVERGDAGGMSFGFTTPKGGDEWRGTHRTLRSIQLHEISVITSHPAYTATTVDGLNLSRKIVALQVGRFVAAADAMVAADLSALRQARQFPSYAGWIAGTPPPPIPQPAGGMLLGPNPDSAPATGVAGYSARPNGRGVEYRDGRGRLAFTDLGAAIAVVRTDRAAVRTALELGLRRWGRVEVTGGAAFLSAAAAIALDEGWTLDGKQINRAIAAERERRRAELEQNARATAIPTQPNRAAQAGGPHDSPPVPVVSGARTAIADTSPPAGTGAGDSRATGKPDSFADAYGLDSGIDAWIDHARAEPTQLNRARALAAHARGTRPARPVCRRGAPLRADAPAAGARPSAHAEDAISDPEPQPLARDFRLRSGGPAHAGGESHDMRLAGSGCRRRRVGASNSARGLQVEIRGTRS
jgi:hypothetical protein